MARGIVIQITGDGESARKALEMVQQELRETAESTKRETGEMAEAMERVKTALEFAGIYASLEAVKEGIKELVVGSLELGESMEQASRKTGLSVESLSVLHYATGLLGTDFNSLVTAVGRMEKQIGLAADGNKQAAALMQSLGLNAKELASRTDGAEVAFHKFVDTIASTENPVRRAQLAQQLLGRAGAEQIPVLIEVAEHWDEFKQKAKDAGVLLDTETAAKLADTKQRLADLQQHIQGAGLAFTEGLTPSLNQMFSVISGGKSQMDAMAEWGRVMGKLLAGVGDVAYTAAAGVEYLFSGVEGGKLSEIGRRDLTDAQELMKKAQAMHDIAFGGSSAPNITKPFISGTPTEGGHTFAGAPVKGPTKSGNPIAEAGVRLVEEQAKAAADKRKQYDQQQLADLDAQHRLLLVSDAEYYSEKLRLEQDSIDAEADAMKRQIAALEQLQQHQHKDKALKHDKSGVSAEEQQTQARIIALQDQLGQLETRRTQLQDAVAAERGSGVNNAELAGLRAAAALERERNQGIAAQIELIRREHEIEAEKLELNGNAQGAADVRAAGELAAEKLQLEDIEKRIGYSLADNKQKTDALADAARKDPRLQDKVRAATNQLNAQEAANVAQLVREYQQLARAIGDPALVEKAKQLQTAVAELRTPNKRDDAQWAKTLGNTIGNMSRQLVDAAMAGKQSFHDMAKSIEMDVVNLALKMAEEKWLIPMIEGAVGTGAAGTGTADVNAALGMHADGTNNDEGGPQIIGERGPEVWQPPTRGGSILSNKDLASKLSGAGGASGAPKVNMNIVNQSSQPVTASAPKVDYHAQLHEFTINAVLSDLSTGGPLAQALRG